MSGRLPCLPKHRLRGIEPAQSSETEPGIPNAAEIIQTAIPTAVAAWNSAGAGAGLVICRQGTPGCDDKNADTFIVTVRLGHGSSCSKQACVKPTIGTASAHLPNMDVIVEEPALIGNARFRWTDVADDNNDPVPTDPEHTWKYVGAVMVHEFGHTLGLGHPSASDVPGVMAAPDTYTSITQADIDYLMKLYSGHVRGE